MLSIILYVTMTGCKSSLFVDYKCDLSSVTQSSNLELSVTQQYHHLSTTYIPTFIISSKYLTYVKSINQNIPKYSQNLNYINISTNKCKNRIFYQQHDIIQIKYMIICLQHTLTSLSHQRFKNYSIC